MLALDDHQNLHEFSEMVVVNLYLLAKRIKINRDSQRKEQFTQTLNNSIMIFDIIKS